MDCLPSIARTAGGDAMGNAVEVSQAPPDWTTLDRELHCPRCDYNLHMLTSPRCPECGLEFVWSDLLSASARGRDCPIFEYWWRRRPVRSFFYTLWLAIRPWRCWRVIRIEYEPRLAPLVAAMVLLLALQSLVPKLGELFWDAAFRYTRQLPFDWVFELSYLAKSYASLDSYPPFFLRSAIPLLLLLGAISIYRITYSRWRIRSMHVVRVVLYAWMGLISVELLFSIATTLIEVTTLIAGFSPTLFKTMHTLQLSWWVSRGVLFVSLGRGLSDYLKLRGGWIASFASLLLVTVALTTLSVAYVIYGRQRTFGASLAHLDHWIPGLQWFCLRVLSAQ